MYNNVKKSYKFKEILSLDYHHHDRPILNYAFYNHQLFTLSLINHHQLFILSATRQTIIIIIPIFASEY